MKISVSHDLLHFVGHMMKYHVLTNQTPFSVSFIQFHPNPKTSPHLSAQKNPILNPTKPRPATKQKSRNG